VKLAHLDTAPNVGSWVHMVSSTAAAALGDKDSAKVGLLRVGEPADFIVFDARKYAMPSLSNVPNKRSNATQYRHSGLWFHCLANCRDPVDRIYYVLMVLTCGRYDELLSRPQTDRVVVRSGAAISSVLPAYSELDRLVNTLTEVNLDGEGVDQLKRGATTVEG
jgi:hypothetical protein